MSWEIELFAFLFMLLGLLLIGMWVPFAIGIGGLAALYFNFGASSFSALGLITWGTLNSFTLVAIPLFIFMAEILARSGVSDIFFQGLSHLVRRLPGGLLQTNIAGCALFAAISGSSVATAATIGTVSWPQLKERGYDAKMACGSLAAGGTLGILIPPSITMIIYGTLTEVSIAKLFMAGVLPGIGLAIVFMIFIWIRCAISPSLAPRGKLAGDGSGTLLSFLRLVPFLALIGAVLGGIYTGLTTPTEAAGLGCTLAMFICIGAGKFNLRVLKESLIATVKPSATLLFIVLTAFIFAYAVETAGIGDSLKEFVHHLELGPTGFLLCLIAIYALLGCVLDGAGMVILTVPLFFPLLKDYGIDPVWFGIFLVIMVEFGMLTPPFGINLFVVKAITGQSMATVVWGCVPYYWLMLGWVALLMAFPVIVLWLPGRM